LVRLKPHSLVDIAELRMQANEARHLASTFKDRAIIRDLLNYASALERDAAQWDEVVRKNPGAPLAACFSAWWNALFAMRAH
jgi:hypothetical protein